MSLEVKVGQFGPSIVLGVSTLTSEIARSKAWFGRRFRLSDVALHWGRFYVEDKQYSALEEAAKCLARQRFREANPQRIADAFEQLLGLHKPEALSSFHCEMNALAVYEFSKEALASAHEEGLGGYSAALKSISSALNAVLTAVLRSAGAIQDEGVELVEYSPTLATPYAAVFKSQGTDYDAVFDCELVLKSVHQRAETRRIWPPLDVGRGQSALVASLS